jgi:dCMP deaminase
MSFGTKWDARFLDLAAHVASWSKDPGTQVGAVIVRPDRTIASLGYNGFPRGVDDTYTTRDDKLLRTVHAEMNAILASRERLDGCTVYVYPLCPCSNCAAAIIQSGISTVVHPLMKPRPEWELSFQASADMFAQAGVRMVGYQTQLELDI